MESKISGIEANISGIETKISSIETKMSGMETKISSMETDIKLIQIQQTEHGEILQALRHSSEVHTAKLDNLEVEFAKHTGEQQRSFDALSNMYGHHEFEISKLKQERAS